MVSRVQRYVERVCDMRVLDARVCVLYVCGEPETVVGTRFTRLRLAWAIVLPLMCGVRRRSIFECICHDPSACRNPTMLLSTRYSLYDCSSYTMLDTYVASSVDRNTALLSARS